MTGAVRWQTLRALEAFSIHDGICRAPITIVEQLVGADLPLPKVIVVRCKVIVNDDDRSNNCREAVIGSLHATRLPSRTNSGFWCVVNLAEYLKSSSHLHAQSPSKPDS